LDITWVTHAVAAYDDGVLQDNDHRCGRHGRLGSWAELPSSSPGTLRQPT
jgi:hypothetical protein